MPGFPFLYDRLTRWNSFELLGMEERPIAANGSALGERFNLEPIANKMIEGSRTGRNSERRLYRRSCMSRRFLLLMRPTETLDPQPARTVKEILKERSG